MKTIKYIFLTLFFFIFIYNSKIIINSVLYSCDIFFNKVFVTIFPFIILSNLLIYYDYHLFLKQIFGSFFKKLFNINESAVLVIILSLLSSQPNNSIYIKNLLDNNIIKENEAINLLIFTYFPSITFVLGAIGIGLYNDIKIGVYLLIVNYLCNFSIGIFLRKKVTYNRNNKNIIKSKDSLFLTIKNSILNAINTSIIIFGNICIFIIIINLVNHYVKINPIILSIFNGLLELTSGINFVSLLNVSLKIKIFLTSFILNFSGICVIIQSICILDKNINIKKILIIKLVFSLLWASIFLLT